MLSLTISTIVALICYFATNAMGPGWGILFAVVGFFATTFLINRRFGGRLKAITGEVEGILLGSQAEANKVAQQAQQKNKSMKVVQRQIEKMAEKSVQEALDVLNKAEPLFPWVLLSKKQVSTLRMQLNYQIKNWEEVDKYLPHCMFFDPMTYAMKMARAYERGDEDLEKMYLKGAKKFKKDKGIIIHSLYAWICLKQDNLDRAVEVLATAFEKTGDENLERNWKALANNKAKQFSNHFLGERWYGLHLEKQPLAKQRMRKGDLKNNPIYGGQRGKRRR